MDLNDTPEQAAYRAEVRAWLEQNASHAPATRGRGDEEGAVATHRAWQRKLAEGGYVGVTWPAEHGGQGKGPLHQVVINQEIARAGVPGILDVDRRRHARPDDDRPRHRRAEAALPRPHAARRRGVVPALLRAGRRLGPRGHPDRAPARTTTAPGACHGQKVWTTNAQFAAYGLLLARTDPDAHKHKGLTMFVVPMDAEGVTIRAAAPDLRRGRVQRGLLRRRAAGRPAAKSAP